MHKKIFLLVAILASTILACNYSFSTANIIETTLAYDAAGTNPTTIFSPDDAFYFVVSLANAPEDTTLKASWTAIDIDGLNTLIDEVEIISGSGTLTFDLSSNAPWPAGSYKVDLFINDELNQTVAFTVEEMLVEIEPQPTNTPLPASIATPESPPSEVAANSLGDSIDVTGSSAGDTLSDNLNEIEQTAILPFQATPYLHPSGVFSLAIPIDWKLITESKMTSDFGNDSSVVGVEFLDVGQVLDQDELAQFINSYLEDFVQAQPYEVITQKDQPDGSIYWAVTWQSESGQTIDGDFFFEQHNTIVFILYLSTVAYDEINPTWNEIVVSYQINAQAARAALPTQAVPTLRPPSPTPVPTVNPFAPPPRVARVYLQNFYSNEYNIDFGDGQGSIQVMPGVDNFYHDLSPGKYNPGLSLPGRSAMNVEFEIQADQSWLIIVDADLGVKWGQVYP